MLFGPLGPGITLAINPDPSQPQQKLLSRASERGPRGRGSGDPFEPTEGGKQRAEGSQTGGGLLRRTVVEYDGSVSDFDTGLASDPDVVRESQPVVSDSLSEYHAASRGDAPNTTAPSMGRLTTTTATETPAMGLLTTTEPGMGLLTTSTTSTTTTPQDADKCNKEWGDWGECNEKNDGKRWRIVEARPQGTWADMEKWCKKPDVYVGMWGSEECEARCKGKFLPWGESVCNGTHRTRKFIVEKQAFNGGRPCPEEIQECQHCKGEFAGERTCDKESGNYTARLFKISVAARNGGKACEYTAGKHSEGPCPVDCEGKWLDFRTEDCDLRGKITPRGMGTIGKITRGWNTTVTQKNGGKRCENEDVGRKSFKRTKRCRDCLGAWSEWGVCDQESGLKSRKYEVELEASNGGRDCPNPHGQGASEKCAVDCQGKFSESGRGVCESMMGKAYSLAPGKGDASSRSWTHREMLKVDPSKLGLWAHFTPWETSVEAKNGGRACPKPSEEEGTLKPCLSLWSNIMRAVTKVGVKMREPGSGQDPEQIEGTIKTYAKRLQGIYGLTEKEGGEEAVVGEIRAVLSEQLHRPELRFKPGSTEKGKRLGWALMNGLPPGSDDAFKDEEGVDDAESQKMSGSGYGNGSNRAMLKEVRNKVKNGFGGLLTQHEKDYAEEVYDEQHVGEIHGSDVVQRWRTEQKEGKRWPEEWR